LRGPEDGGIAPLRHDDGAAVFEEPWQAQILALADTLARSGLFTPTAWSAALGAALRHAESHGAPDTPATYYAAAVEALEGLLADTGLLSSDVLAERREAWRQAYQSTPHGQPVTLGRG
jgi:nitrile hydratase accessory protein